MYFLCQARPTRSIPILPSILVLTPWRDTPLPFNNSSERVVSLPFVCTLEGRKAVSSQGSAESRHTTDEALLIALKTKDRDALSELFRRHSRLVFSIGLRVLRDVGEAEEIVQEVFLFLHQRAELFDEKKGGAKAWLVQVAYHRSLDRKEYLHRRNFYFGTDVGLLADTLQGKQMWSAILHPS